MILKILIVGSGSFLGGAARYLISSLMKGHSTSFPWGTLTVNLAGCFLIGFMYALLSRYLTTSSNWFLLLITGLCGGFTTFSTFANESLSMIQNGNIWGFTAYICASIIGGILLTYLGYLLIK